MLNVVALTKDFPIAATDFMIDKELWVELGSRPKIDPFPKRSAALPVATAILPPTR